MTALCLLADPANYRPFDWEQDQDDRAYWLDLFASFPKYIERRLREDGLGGEDFEARWRAFLEDYEAGMRRWRTDPEYQARLSTIALGAFRQAMLDRHGWTDPYAVVKRRENELASSMYPDLVRSIDAAPAEQRWETLMRGLFAGNMFDLGAPDTINLYNRGQVSFANIRKRIPSRPWFIDDTDVVRRRFELSPRYRQVLFFVDNSGADIVLGVVPLVREIAQRGTRVVLVANSAPALNDITIDELNPLLERLAASDAVLGELLAGGLITTVASGSNSPLIDLGCVSEACNQTAADCDLLVLEGMGRGVESNWRQSFRCDVWRVALIKDRTVAKWLGCKLFDPICRFTPA